MNESNITDKHVEYQKGINEQKRLEATMAESKYNMAREKRVETGYQMGTVAFIAMCLLVLFSFFNKNCTVVTKARMEQCREVLTSTNVSDPIKAQFAAESCEGVQ